MSSPEFGLPPEITQMKSKKLPDNETYAVEGIQEVLKNPKTVEKIQKAAEGRAEDIFESGKLKERIFEGETVLYIGAGTGHVAKKIEDETHAKVIKFDLADLRTPDTKDEKFAMANARRLPIKSESLDTVCLFDILHHTENQEEILEEAMRVLKPGGKCLVMEDTIPGVTINDGAGRIVQEKWIDVKKKIVGKMDDVFNQQPAGVNPHNYHSIADWEKIFEKTGFYAEENGSNSWHWGIPDFLGADRSKRPDHNTIARPFEATMFEVHKPISLDQEIE